MSEAKKTLPSRRPAEVATGVAGAVAAIIVASTGLSTELASALVVVVGALPSFVSAIVSATRSTAAGGMLVSLTPRVAELAGSALEAAAKDSSSLTEKTATLKDVAESMASWSAVLSAEPGTTAASAGEPGA